MRQIILDTETTGLRFEDGHRIIEIGCIELVNRKFTSQRYHQYINPQRAIEEEALSVHGIKQDFLEDKPIFQDISQEFIDFVSGAELIIHNAPFDVGFINYELKLLGKKWKTIEKYCRVFDTLVLARQLHVGQRNSLDALCKRYGVDNTHREFHGALLDAHLLAQVYLAMTGGQGSLFDGIQDHEPVAQEAEAISILPGQTPRKLCVLKANAEEVAAHEAFLKKLMG